MKTKTLVLTVIVVGSIAFGGTLILGTIGGYLNGYQDAIDGKENIFISFLEKLENENKRAKLKAETAYNECIKELEDSEK